MDEELINLPTEETVEVDAEEVVESEIRAEDLEQNIEIEETIETVEVEPIEEIEIEVDEAVGWVGGDSTRHYSLYGRDEPDQHPITSITGLREELNDIEALDVVYSDKRNQANYYLWKDENILQENRVGYFVSACDDINEIEMCTFSNDIFGVTVDGAGFIGAQSDVARDIKYGLVVTTGVVHVRCESSVNVGDYVISNDYGCAQKNKNGYKVVGRHRIDGIEYAEITLTTPINRICQLSNDVENVNQRMDEAETNIVAAINVANAAYNKTGEVGEISEEAIKNALEALDKASDASDRVDGFDSRLEDANELAVQARAIAESAANSAEAIRSEAVDVADEALKDVNDLIKNLEPITTWEDAESGNVGAEYLTTYIKEGLATKAEVQTVEDLTEDNKMSIEKNAEGIQTMISSVDKYSVGEFSQSYGLTHEQAVSILKIGMIYVPTKHIETQSHSETFEDTGEINYFTPGGYYEWNINDQGIYDWIEYKDSVAFFSEEPAPIRTLQYWYIDSNDAPEGYEPYALYAWLDEQWKKVNILAGNANNRVTSMIRQTADSAFVGVINARGEIAGLDARLTENEKSVGLVVKDGKLNSASIIMAIDGDTSSATIGADHIVLNGYTSNANGSFQIDTDGYMIATGGSIAGWNITDEYISKTASDYSGVPGVFLHSPTNWVPGNTSVDSDVLVVRHITVTDAQGNWNTTPTYPFVLKADGTLNCSKINASGGNIAGWQINSQMLSKSSGDYYFYLQSNPYTDGNAIPYNPVIAVSYQGDYKFYVRSNGYLYAKNAEIEGKINATSGAIAGWNLDPNYWDASLLYTKTGTSSYGTGMAGAANGSFGSTSMPAFWAGYWGGYAHPYAHQNAFVDTNNPETYNCFSYTNFYVTHSGAMHATAGDIAGWEIKPNYLGSHGAVNTTTFMSHSGVNAYVHAVSESKDCVFYSKGDFAVDTTGHLYANNATIKGTLQAGSIIGEASVGPKTGGFSYQYKIPDTTNGYFYSLSGDGYDVYDSGTQNVQSGVFSVQVSNTWGRMCSLSMTGESGSLFGTWNVNGGLIGNSDRTLKHDIEPLSDKYSTFFDALEPKRFKYNDGTSGRYHTGFIAQEVYDALTNAGLDSQEVGAYVHLNESTNNEEHLGLRYDEFVAINTMQIQKAKSRITELENEVATLKEQVTTLLNKE